MRSLASLAGGTAAGQAIIVLASPLLTRVFSPAEIGAFSVFTTGAMLINATNSLRYEMAIPVAEDDAEAGHLVWLCLAILGAFSLALSGAIWAWGATLCRILKVPELAPHLWLLSLTVAVAGAYEAFHFFAIRRRDFPALAQSRVTQGMVQSAAQVGLGALSLGALGLVVGDLAGRVGSTVRLAWSARVTGLFRRFPVREVRAVAVRYARFPKYMAGASILNLMALQLPFLLIPGFFGATPAGHYFLAYRTLFLPASFIGGAISQVLLGEAAARVRDGAPLHQLTSRIFLVLSAVYLPLYTVCLSGAGRLFPAVFGPRWAEAGLYAQILAPMTLVWSLARPLAGMLLVRDRLKESLAFTAGELAGMGLALYLGYRSGSMVQTALFISASGLVISVLSVGRFLHAAGVSLPPVLGKFAMLVALNVPLGLVVWAAARGLGLAWTLAAAAVGTGLVGWATLTFLRREGLL